MTTINGSPSPGYSSPTVSASIQQIVSQLTPSEQAEFAQMLGQIMPSLAGLAQSHDSYVPPTSGGSSPITSEYEALSPQQQQDFDEFAQAVVNAMQSPSEPSAVASTSSPTGSTAGAGGASGSPQQQMQYWQDKYQQDWSNPATQGQAGQDWQNYLAAAQGWQAGGSGSTPTPVISTPAPTVISSPSTPVISTPSTPAGSGSSSSGASSTNNGVLPQGTGVIQQTTNSSYDSAAAAKAASTGYPGFPDPSKWVSFDAMWSKYSPNSLQPETFPGGVARGNTPAENASLKQSILDESAKTGIPANYIYAEVLQESGGHVMVPNTNNGVENRGLMQTHNGVAYDPNNSASSIAQMIKDGVEGTYGTSGGGDGLAQLLAQGGSAFVASRLYNSGSADLSNLNNGLGSTAGYVQGIATFLTGG